MSNTSNDSNESEVFNKKSGLIITDSGDSIKIYPLLSNKHPKEVSDGTSESSDKYRYFSNIRNRFSSAISQVGSLELEDSLFDVEDYSDEKIDDNSESDEDYPFIFKSIRIIESAARPDAISDPTGLYKGDANYKGNGIKILNDASAIIQSLPRVEVTVYTQSELSNIGDKQTLTISSSSGKSTSCKMYIYDIEEGDVELDEITYKLIGCPKEFLQNPGSAIYDDAIDAIEKNYYGEFIPDKSLDYFFKGMKLLDRYEYYKGSEDIPKDKLQPFKYIKKNETPIKFLHRIIPTFARNIRYAFTLDGLKIINLERLKPGDVTIDKETQMVVRSSIRNSEPTGFDTNPEIIEKYSNHVKIRWKGTTYDLNTEQYEQLMNSMMNRNRMSKGFFTGDIKSCLDYSILQPIKIISEKHSLHNFIVVGRVITIDRENLKIHHEFESFNPFNEGSDSLGVQKKLNLKDLVSMASMTTAVLYSVYSQGLGFVSRLGTSYTAIKSEGENFIDNMLNNN